MKIENLLAPLSHPSENEFFQELLRGVGHPFTLERIVSSGHATAEGRWCDQETDEWVLLLSGAAQLRFEAEGSRIAMGPGDSIHIPAHCRHRVEWTDPREPTVWLALHFEASSL